MREEEHESFQKLSRSRNGEEEIESSRGSRHGALLKGPVNHV
jgi:hypothetical protein